MLACFRLRGRDSIVIALLWTGYGRVTIENKHGAHDLEMRSFDRVVVFSSATKLQHSSSVAVQEE